MYKLYRYKFKGQDNLYKCIKKVYGFNSYCYMSLIRQTGLNLFKNYKFSSISKFKLDKFLMYNVSLKENNLICLVDYKLLEYRKNRIELLYKSRIYKAYRHRYKYPTRGQRNRTNAKNIKKFYYGNL